MDEANECTQAVENCRDPSQCKSQILEALHFVPLPSNGSHGKGLWPRSVTIRWFLTELALTRAGVGAGMSFDLHLISSKCYIELCLSTVSDDYSGTCKLPSLPRARIGGRGQTFFHSPSMHNRGWHWHSTADGHDSPRHGGLYSKSPTPYPRGHRDPL